MQIVRFTEQHWDEVREIYNQGIESRNATFETEVPGLATWHEKFHREHLWVALAGNRVTGWAGLQPVSARKVYAGVAEVTVYVHTGFAGKGVGTALVRHLIQNSENAGIWTLYASIFPENTASIRLHVNHGFREIGYRERIAQLDGNWRNTILFERRSKKTGV
ncbi:MAG TPA: GNAT family N-acetyltransferase [Chryseosolibacter sp.]|nr:GNAT family N-acetyltransferase [Chryseosolibacter sp.]